MTDHTGWAAHLHCAQRERRAVDSISEGLHPFGPADAYDVQDAVLALRLQEGERLIGAKLGLTSRAKQEAMGVDEPIYAPLTDAMLWSADAPISVGELIHPRVEPEIVFVLGEQLSGPGVTSADVLRATAGYTCGLEVIDSRYRDFRFTHADVVADLASAAGFVIGTRLVAEPGDLALLGCTLEVGGRVVDTAAGAAIMGDPAEAVAQLANHLGARGQCLEAGAIVLSGGLTNAVPLPPRGEVRASFGRLGSVSLRVA
jgi:2-oxo-3-hexenedioate decarboxylase